MISSSSGGLSLRNAPSRMTSTGCAKEISAALKKPRSFISKLSRSKTRSTRPWACPASRLGFIGAMNGQTFTGTFRRWDAHIQFDPKALEMSNVNLAQEFTNLIEAQRGFQANSRVITTSDSLLEEVVNLKH